MADHPHLLQSVVQLGPGRVGGFDELGQVLLHDRVEDAGDEEEAFSGIQFRHLAFCFGLVAEGDYVFEIVEAVVEVLIGETNKILDVRRTGSRFTALFTFVLHSFSGAIADHLRVVALEVSDDLIHPPGLLLTHPTHLMKLHRFILHLLLILHPILVIPILQQPLPYGILILIELLGADIVP